MTGAALGPSSSTYAGWGALIGGGVAAAYCWANGMEEETVAVVETVEPMPQTQPEPEPAAAPVRVELDVKFDFTATWSSRTATATSRTWPIS